jgi:hypothetical protein
MSVLMKDHEQLTAELLHVNIEALRRRQMEGRVREVSANINEEQRKGADPLALARLTQEKQHLERILRQLSTN